MHLLLRIILLTFGILEPGICSECFVPETLYTIFTSDNCTSYFIVWNPRVLLDMDPPLCIFAYKGQAIELRCFRNILRWEPAAVTVDWDITYFIFFDNGVFLLTISLSC